jgi:hypothetical protein
LAAAASATLALGMGASRPDFWHSCRPDRLLCAVYEGITRIVESWPAGRIVAQVRESDPKVYVDGQLAAPLRYGPLVVRWVESRMDVEIPGDGIFSVTPHQLLDEWVEAGRIHGNTIEFQAGGKAVRIVCAKPIVDADVPVYVMPRADR